MNMMHADVDSSEVRTLAALKELDAERPGRAGGTAAPDLDRLPRHGAQLRLGSRAAAVPHDGSGLVGCGRVQA